MVPVPADPDAVSVPVHAMAILTAIPVVLFALWADYFGRYVDSQAGKPDFDRRLHAWRVHVTGLSVFILQAVIYLGSRSFRLEHPGLALLFFFAGLMAQSQIQFGLEKKVRGLAATHAEHAGMAGRTFGWIALMILVYFGAIYAAAAGTFVVARVLGASQPLAAALALVGAGTGILTGLALAFAFAPRHLRRLFPTKPLEDPELRGLFDECFARAGVAPPDYFVIESDRFRTSNALVAGFPSGRGWLKPALFVTRSVLNECPREELRAVILHEVSHLALAHLRRRLGYSIGIVATATLISALLIGAASLIREPLASFIRLLTPIAAFFVPFGAIRMQVRRHEFEADVHAVLKLGAGADALASALRRIDGLNDEFSDRKPADARLVPGTGHPMTEERIQLLEKAVREASPPPPASDADDERKAA
jgi:Zn-dependent protease with chaperone function